MFRFFEDPQSETKVHQVGDVCLVIKKIEDNHWAKESGKTHRVCILNGDKEIEGSSWFISRFASKKYIDGIFEAMGKETPLLIEKLKSANSLGSKKSAMFLQDAFDKKLGHVEKKVTSPNG
jgi:hypothetical protein